MLIERNLVASFALAVPALLLTARFFHLLQKADELLDVCELPGFAGVDIGEKVNRRSRRDRSGVQIAPIAGDKGAQTGRHDEKNENKIANLRRQIPGRARRSLSKFLRSSKRFSIASNTSMPRRRQRSLPRARRSKIE